MEMTQKVVITAAFGFGDINFHEFCYAPCLILGNYCGFSLSKIRNGLMSDYR
jgi:hypothetical protein